jgi:transposase InsO family protein
MYRNLFMNPFIRGQIVEIAERISRGLVHVRDGFSQLRDEKGNLLEIDYRTILKFCQEEGIEVTANRGRPRIAVKEGLEEFVCSKGGRYGAMKMYELALSNDFDASREDIYKRYAKHDLFKFQGERKTKEVRCRYEACQRDLIWHTDLHEVDISGVRMYIIAFLDDASRLIVGWNWMESKHSRIAADRLNKTLNEIAPVKPYVLWSDNGGEFMGDFERLLNDKGIYHFTTKPYNPQQNGKIERFWQNLTGLHEQIDVARRIEEYNHIPHSALPVVQLGRRCVHMSPLERYNSLPSWVSGRKSWIKDGMELDFDMQGIKVVEGGEENETND